jgi:hypothetical protein
MAAVAQGPEDQHSKHAIDDAEFGSSDQARKHNEMHTLLIFLARQHTLL